MDTHPHSFATTDWPFDDPPNVTAISTRPVIEDAHPVLLVTHDEDGDWQILCGTTNEPPDGRIVCLGCAFERDRSIGQLADLPRGWRAWRDSATGPWHREPKEAET
jgi:hypothetical protein